MRRDVSFFGVFEGQKASASFATATGEDRVRLRSAYTHHLRDLLAAHQSLFARHAQLLVDRFNAVGEDPVDILAVLSTAMLNLMAHLYFGRPPRSSADGAWSQWAENRKAWTKSSVINQCLSELRLVRLALKLIPSTLLNQRRRFFFDLTGHAISRRLQSGTEEPDLVGLSLRSDDRRHQLSENDLKANTPFVMGAGIKPTATCLSNLLYFLQSNQYCLERLVEEIRGTFPSSASIDAASTTRLPYLDACIKESLQIFSPATGSFPRSVPPPGATIAGRWVPGGTRVSMSLFAALRSPEYFHQSDDFVPQRWLQKPGSSSGDRKAAFQPFATGRQNCIGQESVSMETRFLQKLTMQQRRSPCHAPFHVQTAISLRPGALLGITPIGLVYKTKVMVDVETGAPSNQAEAQTSMYPREAESPVSCGNTGTDPSKFRRHRVLQANDWEAGGYQSH